MPNEPLIVFREGCDLALVLHAEVRQAKQFTRNATLATWTIYTITAKWAETNSASATEEAVAGQATVTGTICVAKAAAKATTDIAAACSLKRIAEGAGWARSGVGRIT